MCFFKGMGMGLLVIGLFLAVDIMVLFFFKDTIPLYCEASVLKVHQKSDNLMLRFTVKVSYLSKCIATVHRIKTNLY